METKRDIIFCSIPFSNVDHIYSAPAILKGVVESEGYSAKTIDFGLELFNLCNRDRSVFDIIQLYFYNAEPTLTEEEFRILDKWRQKVKIFVEENPTRYFGVSIMSFMQQVSAYEICEIIREVDPEIKIVIGGRGAKIPVFTTFHKKYNIKGMEKLMSAGEFLKKRGKCDYVVLGDGESPIIEILQGGEKSIIEHEDRDSFSYPEPNYEDYFLDQYIWDSGEIAFPITGSKGCVRDCDFCDIKFQFGRFKYRSGQDIANEMLSIQEKYGFNKFQFTDSLVNGGLKPFREFITLIADHNKNNPDKKIKWSGQYICRPELTMPKDLYELMKESGAEGLTIGAESGSDHVLEQMNKKTTVDALLTELEEFRKHGIRCVLLVMVAHWSERWEDFNEHCRTLIKILPYMRDGTISGIVMGWIAKMLEGTPSLERIMDERIIASDDLSDVLWFNKENPMDLKERLYRRLIIGLIGRRLQMPTVSESHIFRNHYEEFHSHVDLINNFYDQYKQELESPSPSERAFYNFDEWYDGLMRDIDISVKIVMSVDDYNGSPNVKIRCNGKIHMDSDLTYGEHTVEFTESVRDLTSITISMEMLGKRQNDTKVDTDGNILRDKHVKIEKLIVNNYDLSADSGFIYSQFKAWPGLWQDGILELTLSLPFDKWYNSVNNNNATLAPEMSSKNYQISFDDNFRKLLSLTESLK